LALFAYLLLACAPPSYWAEGARSGSVDVQNAQAASALARARALDLWRAPAWLKLVHYRTDRLGSGLVSEIDSPGFFLAPTGRISPQAELEATIRAVLSPAQQAGRLDPDSHAICRYPARTLFLIEHLSLDPMRLPVRGCPKFAKFLEDVRPDGIALIFASAYLNSPASAAGHTFLRLNKRRDSSRAAGQELLDYGVDYSANVTTNNPILYALLGFSGGFRGTFKTLPYYYKVREYSDMESRDLWEYDLALAPDALTRLTAHLWELDEAHFDYFYLSENCSYHVLGLLEAARPDLELVSRLRRPVVPSATVRILSEAGVIGDAHFRPSMRTMFVARMEALSPAQRRWVGRLAANPEAPFSPGVSTQEQARTLDAAMDLSDLLRESEHGAGGAAGDDSERLLSRRAKLRVVTPTPSVSAPPELDPRAAHGTFRAGLGGGFEPTGAPFIGLDLRPALHDLADAPAGYPELGQVDFLATRLRLSRQADRLRVRLDELAVVRVISLADLNPFEHKSSYRLELGARGVDDASCRRCTVLVARVGSGVTKVLTGSRVALFLTGDVELTSGPRVSGLGGGEARLGMGPWGGVRARLLPSLIALLAGEWLFFPGQSQWNMWQARATVRWSMGRNVSLSFEGRFAAAGATGQVLTLVYF